METKCGSSGFWIGLWKGSQADDVLFEAAAAMFVRAGSQRMSPSAILRKFKLALSRLLLFNQLCSPTARQGWPIDASSRYLLCLLQQHNTCIDKRQNWLDESHNSRTPSILLAYKKPTRLEEARAI